MNQSNKIIIAAIIIVIIVVPIGAYAFLNSAFASLEQKEDKNIIGATQNVEIQATTFNGKIEIQTIKKLT